MEKRHERCRSEHDCRCVHKQSIRDDQDNRGEARTSEKLVDLDPVHTECSIDRNYGFFLKTQ